jgi:hypothetical protein
MPLLLLHVLLLSAAVAPGPPTFDLLASFEPPEKPGGDAAVVVRFRTLDPDLRLNATPAPRLELDLTETVLLDRQAPPPRRVPDYDPLSAQYLDLDEPVRFPVAIAPTAPSGPQSVEAKVAYFYCSVREAWCRRGTADVDFTVTVVH